MAERKDDASIDVEKKVKDFAKDINAEIEKIRKARLDALDKAEKGEAATGAKKVAKSGTPKTTTSVPVVSFSLSRAKVSESRTPTEQAKQVIAKSTKVCWSSHMADAARHVIMKVDAKTSWDPQKTFGDDFETFKKK